MTIELERREKLGQPPTTTILEPGKCVVMPGCTFIGPEIHLQVISDAQIEVIKLYPGDEVRRHTLEEDEINKSKDTYRFLPGVKVSWRPTPIIENI